MGIFGNNPGQTTALSPQQPSERMQMEQNIDSIYGYQDPTNPQNPEDESAMSKFMKYLIALRRSQMARSQQQYKQMV
jgi:hypothetical protein